MKTRGRPKKTRIIQEDPRISQFSPRGRPGRPDESSLSLDEFEALRLADFLGLSQVDASKSMRVSQQTFSRIIKRARKIIADCLVHGKIIRIQGGRYLINHPTEKPAKIRPKMPQRIYRNI
jgi:predicted DNA-binding protein (UPF0251 family)